GSSNVSILVQRRLPVGAEPANSGTHFRLWAPFRRSVDVVIEGFGAIRLDREPNGYFSGLVESAQPRMRYRFRLDHCERLFPDPASRFQPEGPHGPSEIVSASSYSWRDDAWPGVRIEGQVISEMHVGTFTPAGTWNAASEALSELKDVGITLLELMPV